MTNLSYAFIGLGHLGCHLAASLVRNGFAVTVYDRDLAAIERLVALGATAAPSPADAAARAGNAITCLPSPKISESGPDRTGGLLAGLPEDGTWIEMTTNGRDEDYAPRGPCRKPGASTTLDCPVTGGVHLAASGEITVLVGGDTALFERHRAAIEAMGGEKSILGAIARRGDQGRHQHAGLHPSRRRRRGADAGQEGWRGSRPGLSRHQRHVGQQLRPRDRKPACAERLLRYRLHHGSGAQGSRLRLSHGQNFGVPLDLAGRVAAIFEQGKAAYGGDAWSTMIVKLLEDATGTDLRAPGFPARLEI